MGSGSSQEISPRDAGDPERPDPAPSAEPAEEDPSLQGPISKKEIDSREPAEPCCGRLCGSLSCSDQLLDPVAQKPFGTDAASLLCSQDGCSENAREICLALSGSPEPRQELSSTECYALALEDGRLDTRDGYGLMPAKLYVPVNFGQLAYDWSAPSSSQPAISDAEMAKLQDCLTIFIEAMLRGVIVQLRIDENETGRQGCNLLAVVALPSSLEELVIISGGLEQTIRMSCIRWVRPLEKGRRTGSCLWPGSERRKMVHISLDAGCFLRLRFEQEDQAAFFGTCMRLLGKASQSDSLPD
ncbi:unnamed protein product [Symbiodinium necroappetens]|uniref:Uncharacterized protein n=1 Tax=Symbiodinium necroappetens TaxID=1628268 RepID=A0A812S940_9DINO|nr:unnamed protein product [Symbiodinium necroappetens]